MWELGLEKSSLSCCVLWATAEYPTGNSTEGSLVLPSNPFPVGGGGGHPAVAQSTGCPIGTGRGPWLG